MIKNFLREIKEYALEDIKELWSLIKALLIMSGVFFWILVILWKINGVL